MRCRCPHSHNPIEIVTDDSLQTRFPISGVGELGESFPPGAARAFVPDLEQTI